jgi:hypothetical protein
MVRLSRSVETTSHVTSQADETRNMLTYLENPQDTLLLLPCFIILKTLNSVSHYATRRKVAVSAPDYGTPGPPRHVTGIAYVPTFTIALKIRMIEDRYI